jgi:hypothetical protein
MYGACVVGWNNFMCDLKLIVTFGKDENINISYNILHDKTTKYTSHVCTYHCKL